MLEQLCMSVCPVPVDMLAQVTSWCQRWGSKNFLPLGYSTSGWEHVKKLLVWDKIKTYIWPTKPFDSSVCWSFLCIQGFHGLWTSQNNGLHLKTSVTNPPEPVWLQVTFYSLHRDYILLGLCFMKNPLGWNLGLFPNLWNSMIITLFSAEFMPTTKGLDGWRYLSMRACEY